MRPSKARGQNFVHDPGTVRRIVRDAGVRPGDAVVEIGPGLGSLTLALLEAGAFVSAVEVDPRLASEYHATLAEGAPYVRDPGAAASLSATSAWTMTVAVSAHGRASNRVRRRGTARL